MGEFTISVSKSRDVLHPVRILVERRFDSGAKYFLSASEGEEGGRGG